MPTYTHTYAKLEVSPAAHAEILGKLLAAKYQDQIHEENGQVLIDMHGIALVTSKTKKRFARCNDCKGVGKVRWPHDRCNCGSGEGCGLHDETAIALWGKKCDKCNGTGIIQNKRNE